MYLPACPCEHACSLPVPCPARFPFMFLALALEKQVSPNPLLSLGSLNGRRRSRKREAGNGLCLHPACGSFSFDLKNPGSPSSTSHLTGCTSAVRRGPGPQGGTCLRTKARAPFLRPTSLGLLEAHPDVAGRWASSSLRGPRAASPTSLGEN